MNYNRKGEMHMARQNLLSLRNEIHDRYKWGYFLRFTDKKDDFGSYLETRSIVVPKSDWDHPTEWAIFAFLHEIGHLETNEIRMHRYYQEYLATQWAIDESKRIGFTYPESFLTIYQNYIYKWRDYCVIRKGKNIKSKEELKLVA